MKRRNATRNALFTSIISLLLCVSMLVGTTFAWFTDTVVSGRNVITAGNLDIKLSTDAGEVNGATELFKNVDGDLWEPGAVAYENFTIENVGNLALKYNMDLTVLAETTTDVNGVVYKLGDAIKVGVVENGVSGGRDAVIAAVSNWTTLSAFQLNKSNVKMEAGAAAHKFAIVLYWQPDVDYTDGNFDNYFNLNNERQGNEALKLEIGVNLYATQVEAESDSFDETYDAKAKYSNSETVTVSADGSVAMTADVTTVEAPAGAFTEGDEAKIEVKTTNTLFNVLAGDNQTVAAVDVTLTVNGEAVTTSLEDGKLYTVTTYISKGLSNVSVAYNGEGTQPTLVSYNAETGKLVFTTSHFSEYIVKAAKAAAIGKTNDTAYTTAEDAAAVYATVDLEIPVENLTAVCSEISGSESKNAFKEAYGIALYGSNNYYLTAAEVVNTVASKDAAKNTLKILKDFELTDTLTIPSGKAWTIDLNGHTISQSRACTASYSMIANNGTLTITDSVGGGKISFTDTGAGDSTNGWASYTINNTGNLTVNGGTIEHLGTQTYNGNNAIFHYSGSVTINDGVISAPYSRSLRVWNGSATINDGTFDGQVWVQAMSDCSLTINNGSFKPATHGNDGSSVFVTNGSHNVTVSITDGYFATKVGASDRSKLADAVSGGTFTEMGVLDYLADGANITIKLADNISETDKTYTIPDGAAVALDLNGHTVSGTSTQTGANQNLFVVKGDLTVSGGSVTVEHTGTNMDWNNLSSAFSVEGGTLTLNDVDVVNEGGTNMAFGVDVNTTLGETVLNINNGTTITSTYTAVRIFNNSSSKTGTVNLNDGTLTGNSRDLWVQNPSAGAVDSNGIVNINNGATYEVTVQTSSNNGRIYQIN